MAVVRLRGDGSRLLCKLQLRGRPPTGGSQLVDIIIILVLIGARAALVVFKSLLLALAVVIAALILTFVVRAKPQLGKGLRPKWTAKCPKCKNVMNSSEVACGNCGAHTTRMIEGKTGKKLKCGKCDMAVDNPKCPKCETIIAPKFWH